MPTTAPAPVKTPKAPTQPKPTPFNPPKPAQLPQPKN